MDTENGNDRPKWRTTLSYRVTPRFQAGVEVNATVGEAGPIANWFAVTENERRPALIFGTSSDRIGTPKGRQAWYATLAKQVGDLPVAPYVSLNYSGADRRINFPFGASILAAKPITLTPMYDGHAAHTMVTWAGKHESVTLIAAWNRRFGISFGLAF